jgi:hypothetical protein
MNSTKKIEKGRIEDFISDSTKVELDKRIQSINGITPDANGAATLALTQVVDNLTSVETTKALSANQGKVLKGLIDTINGVLQSDDGTLDELQEIVNYIKQNKTDLQNLSIGNIAGLTQALADAEANANTYTDNNFVPKVGDSSINGVVTFLSPPIAPTPVNPTEVVNKAYADAAFQMFSPLLTTANENDTNFPSTGFESYFNQTLRYTGTVGSLTLIGANSAEGSHYLIINKGSGMLTLNCTGDIWNQGTVSDSINVLTNEILEIKSDGTHWIVISKR